MAFTDHLNSIILHKREEKRHSKTEPDFLDCKKWVLQNEQWIKSLSSHWLTLFSSAEIKSRWDFKTKQQKIKQNY